MCCRFMRSNDIFTCNNNILLLPNTRIEHVRITIIYLKRTKHDIILWRRATIVLLLLFFSITQHVVFAGPLGFFSSRATSSNASLFLLRWIFFREKKSQFAYVNYKSSFRYFFFFFSLARKGPRRFARRATTEYNFIQEAIVVRLIYTCLYIHIIISYILLLFYYNTSKTENRENHDHHPRSLSDMPPSSVPYRDPFGIVFFPLHPRSST